jgi:hypothetical protein
MSAACVVCTKPLPDTAYACTGCMCRAGYRLTEIADMVPAARDIAHGLSNHGGTGGSGKPGSRLPLDLGATARLDAVQNELGGWARITLDERQGQPFAPGPVDPIIHAAYCLAANLEWWRHRPAVAELLGDIEACARVVRGIARGPAERLYLGTCGARVTWDDDGNEIPRDTPCAGDVYAHQGATDGMCRACQARWTVTTRRAWLDGEVRQRNFRAAHIAEAHGVNVNTIRTWHARGLLAAHGEDRDGRPLFNVGEVLDMFRAAAARKAEGQARRARRAATTEVA